LSLFFVLGDWRNAETLRNVSQWQGFTFNEAARSFELENIWVVNFLEMLFFPGSAGVVASDVLLLKAHVVKLPLSSNIGDVG